MAPKRDLSEQIAQFLKIAFINGLITILPITFTVALFMLSFRLVINWLRPVQEFIGDPVGFLVAIQYKAIANQLFLLLLGVLAIGIIIKALLLKRLIHQFEELLFKLPLVRPVYSGIRQLIRAFSVQDNITFKKVVIAEFPYPGIYSIGFLTSELPRAIAPRANEKFYTVFIPTTPNPTSGFLVVLPEKEIKSVDLTTQEAMAMIISGGIIQPERLLK